jgi:serine/threonine protein kinase
VWHALLICEYVCVQLRAVVLSLWRDMDVVLFTTVAHQHFLAADAAATAAAAVSSQPTGVVPPVGSSSATPAESLARADKLIASLRPAEEANAAPTAESLALARQVRVASSLPPRVKYSDFVFGHLLGEGSFAQVRYAKWIQRGQLPSAWPEFAVKILSKELVAAQHYEANLAREIRIMHRLAHENINRLVGLCENATNTYLVLEYAPKGDLHSLIASLGSLDVPSVRFVAAEILRALEEIHRNEIVYVDLKPENVLVHSSGHIKLGDFGSSRFFDEVGAEGTDDGVPAKPDRLEGTADYLAPELLREQFAISPASDLSEHTHATASGGQGCARVCMIHSLLTLLFVVLCLSCCCFSTVRWAFACTLYQMLAGRTPIWAEELAALPVADTKGNDGFGAGSSSGGAGGASDGSGDSSMSDEERSAAHDAAMAAHEAAQKSHLLKKMVQFESGLGEDRYPDGFDPAARALIDAIMLPDPAQRIGVRRRTDAQGQPLHRGVAWTVDYAQLRAHPFFTGVDWVALPTLPAPNLTVGSVAPAPKDAQWARRKNSIMWAPMPRSYTFAEGAIVMPTIREDLAAETATGSNVQRGLGGASGSLRAQMFADKSGSLGAPRFASLKDGGQEGDESASASMQLTEGDEEGEDDEEEDDGSSDEDSQMNGEGGGATTVSFRPGGSSELFNRMHAAPLPTSSGGSSSIGLPPRPQGKASSRASGPMAVVEPPREEDEWQSATGNSVGHGPPMAGAGAAAPLSAAGSTHAALPPRQPLGLHSHTHGTGMLPPSGAARGSGSFVPLADATAGPRGLGMGLRGPGPRQMGGGATASALLARVLGKPATGGAGVQMHMHPMAPLPEGSAAASLPPQQPPQQPQH